ncbi:MAG: c-type cytochrome [Phycisphaerales bacterium]
MRRRRGWRIVGAGVAASLAAWGCERPDARAPAGAGSSRSAWHFAPGAARAVGVAEEAAPSFGTLWSGNCAGCHGADGTLGPAFPLRNAAYLASVPREQLIRVVSQGSGPGTLMPGFGAAAGGGLTDQEIALLVDGMVAAWGRGGAASRVPWAAPAGSSGVAARGRSVFESNCASCHPHGGGESGGGGNGGGAAAPAPGGPRPTDAHPGGSITDGFYLRLVSDQALRTAIVFGRQDLGMPGCDGPYPEGTKGGALSAQDVNDLVAWLAQARRSGWPPRSAVKESTP